MTPLDVVRGVLGRLPVVVLSPLLLRQGRRVVERMPRLPEAAGDRVGTEAPGGGSDGVRLLVLGESTAAGVGVAQQQDGLARLVAVEAAEPGRSVTWQVSAKTGATAAYTVRTLLAGAPADQDVAVVALGVNDALRFTPRSAWRTSLGLLLDTLRRDHLRPGALVVLSGVPDLSVFGVLPQPLRSVLGGHARVLDRELQHLAASTPDVVHVAMPPLRWPEMFADDGFHPNAAAYRAWARQLAPAVRSGIT